VSRWAVRFLRISRLQPGSVKRIHAPSAHGERRLPDCGLLLYELRHFLRQNRRQEANYRELSAVTSTVNSGTPGPRRTAANRLSRIPKPRVDTYLTNDVPHQNEMCAQDVARCSYGQCTEDCWQGA
jgi:hypothetical protein